MSTQKKYWLGYEKPNAQDKFFLEALNKNIWSAGSSDDWDACWSTDMPDPKQFKSLDENKTINHIPGNSALTIKSNLYTTLHKAKLAVQGLAQEERYHFFPKTYSMPEEYFDFQQSALDDPSLRWIQKPRNMSRGRGIEVVQHPETVPLDNQWIIQQYLDKPHLWNGYKYALRCYVLVTSVEPLRFYWYHEGSAKLTSEKYDLDDLDNPYRHLTNPDINEENSAMDNPVVFHSFEAYKDWLRSGGINAEELFEKIQDLISLTVIAARETMRNQTDNYNSDTQGAYELLGLDLVVDSDLKPWILECNLSPSLETCSTDPAQAKKEIETKKGLVTEIVEMLGLNDQDTLTQGQRAQRELDRAKGFKCLFPTKDANNYLNCFPIPRFADIDSLPNEVTINYSKLSLESQSAKEAVFDDSLALLANDPVNQVTSYIAPNELATWIWIQNSEGNTPEQIAQELTQTLGDAIDSQGCKTTWLAQVWDMLADWSQASLFSHSNIQSDSFSDTQEAFQTYDDIGYLNYAGVSVKLRCACVIAGRYLRAFTDSDPLYAKNTQEVDIMRSSFGYVLTNQAHLLAGSRKLSRIMDDCIKLIHRTCLQADDIALVKGSVISLNKKNVLIVGNREQLDGFTYEFCLQHKEAKFVSGAAILASQTNTVKCTDLPLLLPSNTDTISSSYDTSNYYPRKPATANSESTTLVSQDWEISETPSQPCWLAPTKANVGDHVTISSIVFVAPNDAKQSQASIEQLSSANTMASLWINCINKKSNTAEKLPEWLNTINGYYINSADLKQAKTLITSVGEIFK